MSGRELILEVGGEGGSITLVCERSAGGKLQFLVFTSEALLGEDDFPGDGNLPAPSAYADSFAEATALLDKYAWTRLSPIAVHPDYLDQTLQEVRKRGGKAAERCWREALAQR